ncbi:Fasciclin-like arabinogalactan protein 19 [Camellia lanceoleosa]|uniref:Fasciclin-like arabinogalactan protein 19 n=1 Tax=Camellia lanceoleosa TaxID=1840588 RepID=A0ACC0IX79_9ERIC|nr:Fasciclin-like arabinogalactan protein 19 [Camellia lanceoleosa]
MENQSQQSPAKCTGQIVIVIALLFFFFFFVSASATVGSGDIITEGELENVTRAMRMNGYTLFGNAIATSDLRYQILAGKSFTFFAPPDSNLFSLDISSDASHYVQSLRYHVSPLRLSISDLRNLSSFAAPYLHTLLPHHSLLIRTHNNLPTNNAPLVTTVDGVRISYPDLCHGSRTFAVHGLDGILSAVPVSVSSDRIQQKRHQNQIHRKRNHLSFSRF